MSIAGKITDLIDARIAKINTISIGIVTKVDLETWRVSVRLKSRVQDTEIELLNVPVALQGYGAGAVLIAPAVGDIVVIGFSKHEIQKSLRNRDVVAVNDLVLHNANHAIVLSGVYAESDTVPAVTAGEILIRHASGSSIRFRANGDIDITGSHINLVKKS